MVLHGDKDDVEKCVKFLQQKIKDLHSTEMEISRRLYPLLIGKGGANIQRLREQMPDVRLDMPPPEEAKDTSVVRLSGKRTDVDKARKLLEEHIGQLNVSLESSIEQYVTVDPKWHGRFFLNNRKLLTDLQTEQGDLLIKLPERSAKSDQVLLRGSKQAIEQAQKRLEQLVDTWENTTTKEMSIPQRHHGYLLAQRGSYIQPLQKEHNVQIKFPPRQESAKGDIVRITGRSDDVDRVILALEKMIPLEATVDIPHEAHGMLVGRDESQMEALMKEYPDVQITFPPLHSKSNLIYLRGQAEQVDGLKKELLNRYEKYQADKLARSFELRFTIKSDRRPLVIGARGRTINNLMQKFDVNIHLGNHANSAAAATPANGTESSPTHDEQQAAPPAESASSDVEVVITGYEDRAKACRDEILKLIERFDSTITMEIDIDHRIHARIIGSGGQKLQQMMKEYEVDIKFPSNHQSDKVHVSSTNQSKIDACIDHLLMLEEDFLEDLPVKSQGGAQAPGESTFGQQLASAQHQTRQQDGSSANGVTTIKPSKSNNKPTRQAPFRVKNAPWASSEQNGHQNGSDAPRNADRKSSKRGANAPSKDDLGKNRLPHACCATECRV